MTARPTANYSGALIAFCGLDGSGKTTQARLLEQHFSRNHRVYRTRPVTDAFRNDPTLRAYLDGSLAPDVTDSIVPELALFSAMDRLRQMRVQVLPRLRDGEIVLSDRYVYSAYAWMSARGIDDLQWLVSINRHLPEPDATIYLDISPDVALQRIIGRGDTPRWEELDKARMGRVRDIFLYQEWGRSERYHVLDGTLPVDILRKEVARIAEAALP